MQEIRSSNPPVVTEICDLNNLEHGTIVVWVLISQRKKHYRCCTGFPKWIKIQQMHVSSMHLKYALQNKFLNLFPKSSCILSSCILSSSSVSKVFKLVYFLIENFHKNDKFLSNLTSFESCKILTSSFNH